MHVHVVHSGNRRQYLDEIEQMHRQRHRVLVDMLGWTALASPDGLDIDEFDTTHATYLLAIDAGVVRGSLRLIPSWRPHMLKTRLSRVIEGVAPFGPSVWEWSRHAPGDPGLSADDNQQVFGLLSIAVLEFAASRGIETFVGLVDCRLVPYITDMGWTAEPMGLPVKYGEHFAAAFQLPVDLANCDRLRSRLDRHGAVLIEMPSGLAAGDGRMSRHAIELAMDLPPSMAGRAEAALRDLALVGE